MPGVPHLQDLIMPGDRRWSWCNRNGNKVHNKCDALPSSWHHLFLPDPQSVEKLSSIKLVSGAKEIGNYSHVWMWELEYKESWAHKNWCFWTVMLEKTLKSPLDCKEIQPVPPKGNQSWIFIGRTDAEAETPVLWPPDKLTHLKRPWCWERLKVGGEGDDRGCDGWMESPTRWTWVWVSSGGWWWTGRPGTLQSLGSQRVRHHWATELNWTESYN